MLEFGIISELNRHCPYFLKMSLSWDISKMFVENSLFLCSHSSNQQVKIYASSLSDFRIIESFKF